MKFSVPQEFIDRVKEIYPDDVLLHESLTDGRAGNILDEESRHGIHPERVLELIDSGRIDQLRKEAENCVARRQLYVEYCMLTME